MAYVMKGDLDSAAGQIDAVVTLAPAFRIATITGYLADLDTLLGQRRFAAMKCPGAARADTRLSRLRRLLRICRRERSVSPLPVQMEDQWSPAPGVDPGTGSADVVHARRR